MRISLIFGSLWVVAFGQWREIYPNNGQGMNLGVVRQDPESQVRPGSRLPGEADCYTIDKF